MAQTPVPPASQPPIVLINQSGRSQGGMGMGLIMGIVLVLVVGVAIAWFAMSGKMGAPNITLPPVNINPTINVQPPNIKVPDTITINPPAPAPVTPPSAPAGEAAKP